VLDGITLDAQPGQVIGIFGLTGAGKSSLLTSSRGCMTRARVASSPTGST